MGLPNLPWIDDALCAQTDPEAYFPNKGGSNQAAKKICAACPVATACLEHALSIDGLDGIWAGLSPRERARIRRAS